MKDLPKIRGKYFIQRLIAEGEHSRQDFKFSISDARKIARTISAFANAEGGHLLIGVKDNGVIAGVRNEEDIYVVEQAAERYCNPPQEIKFTAYACGEGAVVIRAEVAKCDTPPVTVVESDGSERAYYRVADENIVAPSLMVRVWERMSSGYPAIISLSHAEKILLECLDRETDVTVERFMALSHLSRLSAEEIIVKMAAMKLITFTYRAEKFYLSKPPFHKE